MPELPEVETTRRGLSAHVTRKKIQAIEVRNPHLRWPVDLNRVKALNHQRIIELYRRAKYLIFVCEHAQIISHLGMSGSWRVITDDSEPRLHDHIIIRFCDKTEIRYHDPRRFGCFVVTDHAQTHPLLSALGPEPLSEAFTGDYLFRQLRNKSAAIKTLLMNNAVVVGVGNIYAQEALFYAGIRPAIGGYRLTRKQCEKLVTVVKEVLTHAIADGGTTLKDFVNSDGEPGYFAQQLRVYGRAGQACSVCGTCIRGLQQANRTTSYCPTCQK